jgi:hypothetical protein
MNKPLKHYATWNKPDTKDKNKYCGYAFFVIIKNKFLTRCDGVLLSSQHLGS